MAHFNQISEKNLEILSPEQFVQLLRKLLELEKDKYDLKDAEDIVPEYINHSDGGLDGHIKWTGGPDSTSFIPRRNTGFQVKGGSLSKDRCVKELFEEPRKQSKKVGERSGSDNKALKPAIKAALDEKGAYVLFINMPLIKETSKKSRCDAIKSALASVGYSRAEVDILGRTEIRKWVNNHLSAVHFVLDMVGDHRFIGLMDINAWGARLRAGELSDYILTTFHQEVGVMLNHNLEAHLPFRILGHSGIGKTRMVYELFSKNSPNPKLRKKSHRLIYYDLGEIDATAKRMIDILESVPPDQSGILVVDNCTIWNHRQLVKSCESKSIVLITISNDHHGKGSENVYLDYENQLEVVEGLLAQSAFSGFPLDVKSKIRELSGGNPYMVELLKTFDNFDWSSDDPDMFVWASRLLEAYSPSIELPVELAKAVSSVSTVPFISDEDIAASTYSNEDIADVDKRKMEFLTQIASIKGGGASKSDLKTLINSLSRRELLERKDKAVSIRPLPLALYLAIEWYNDLDAQDLMHVIENSSPELQNKIKARLNDISQLSNAPYIVEYLLSVNGPFGKAELLETNLGSELFRLFALVNPDKTLEKLVSFFERWSNSDLEVNTKGRRGLVNSLEIICTHEHLFLEASILLFRLAESENEEWISNNASGVFRGLFAVRLAATSASLTLRIKALKNAIEVANSNGFSLCVNSMQTALRTTGFVGFWPETLISSGVKESFYRPATDVEINTYQDEIISLLLNLYDLGINTEQVWSVLVNSIREQRKVNRHELIIKHLINRLPEDLEMVADFLQVLQRMKSLDTLIGNSNKQIDDLTSGLVLQNVRNAIYFNVIKPIWPFRTQGQEGEIIRTMLNKTAEKVVENEDELIEHIDFFFQNNGQLSFQFGEVLGREFSDISHLLDPAILKFRQSQPKYPDFIAGLLRGAGKDGYVRRVVDKCLEEHTLIGFATYFAKFAKSPSSFLVGLIKGDEGAKLPVSSFLEYRYGGIVESFEEGDFLELVDYLRSRDFEGSIVALILCHTYIRLKNDFSKSIATRVRGLMFESNYLENKGEVKLDADIWSDHVIRLLNQKDDTLAEKAAWDILYGLTAKVNTYSLQGELHDVTRILLKDYFEIVWPILSRLIEGPDFLFVGSYFLGSQNDLSRNKVGLLFMHEPNYPKLLSWLSKQSDRTLGNFSSMVPIVFRQDNQKVHDFTLKFVESYGHHESVRHGLQRNIGSFSNVGSMVPFYESMKAKVQQFENESNSFKRWKNEQVDNLNELIVREQRNDIDRE